MDYILLSQNTLIPQLPDIINYNFAAFKSYLDLIYDESTGVLVKPVNTTGRVKASSGEFVNLVADNFTVKNQYTNIWENITTANYDYYVAFTGVSAPLRNASNNGITTWENLEYRYIDVQKPYYKIIPDTSVALNTNNLSQVVQLVLDASGNTTGYYRVLIDPMPGALQPYLDISINQSQWVSLICTDYDASYGATWSVYEYAGSGTGSSGEVTALYVANSLLPYATNASVNLALAGNLVALDNIRATYIPDVSLGAQFVWNAGTLDVDISNGGIYATYTYVDGSLLSDQTQINSLSSRVSILEASSGNVTKIYIDGSLAARDASIISLINSRYFTEASLGILTSRHNFTETSVGIVSGVAYGLLAGMSAYATKSYVDGSLANFVRNASLTLYATNSSVNSALLQYITKEYVDGSLSTQNGNIATLNSQASDTYLKLGVVDTSIAWIKTNYIKSSSLGSTLYWAGGLVNVSTNITTATGYVDASLARFVKSASLGEGFSFDNLTGTWWVDVSIVAGGVTKVYVDGSLVTKTNFTYDIKQDASIALKADLTYVNASLNVKTNFTYDVKQDVSIGLKSDLTYVNASLNAKANLTYVDASLNVKTNFTYDVKQDASIGLKADKTYVDASLNAKANLTNVDASLNTKTDFTYSIKQDVSIGLKANQLYVDGSFATNASVNSALSSYATSANVNSSTNAIWTKIGNIDTSFNLYATNASVNNGISIVKATYIPNASLSNDFVWNGATLEVSLGAIYGLDLLASNVSVGLAFASNASLGRLSQTSIIYNASIGSLTSKLNTTDSSLSTLTTRHNFTESSVNTLTTRHNFTESSLNTLASRHNLTESSLNTLTSRHNLTEVSLGTLTTRHNLTEVSLGTLTTRVTDSETSINWLNANKQIVADYVKSASVGTTSFYWHGGVFDVSSNAAYATMLYVDGSFASDQNQINWIEGRVTALEGVTGTVTFAYVNASLNARDTSLNILFNRASLTESSLGTLTVRHNFTETSLGTLTAKYNFTETSLRTLTTRHNFTETSLGTLTTRHNFTETSLGNLDTSVRRYYATNASVNSMYSIIDGAISNHSSQIAGLTSRVNIIDPSITYISNNYLKNASLNASYFKWTAGYLEPSIVGGSGVTQLTLLTDVSLVNLANNDYLRYNSSIGRWVNESTVEASSYFYSKAQVDASFALNSSVNSALRTYATNSSVGLALNYYLKNASLNTSKFKWVTGLLEPSVAATGVTSLSALTDVCINSLSNNNLLKYDSSSGKWINIVPTDASSYFYTKSQTNAKYVSNSSLGIEFVYSGGVLHVDVSVVAGGASLIYVDGSLAVRDGRIAAINSSMNDTLLLNSYVDSSSYLKANYVRNTSLNASYFKWTGGYLEPSVAGGSGDVTKAYVDASLSIRDASIVALFAKNAQQDASISNTANLYSFVNSSSYVDGSLNSIRARYIRDTSLGTGFSWVGPLLYVDVSAVAGGASVVYVDGSLSKRDASIAALFVKNAQQDASINNAANISSYVDSSSYLKANYVRNASLNASYFKWTAGYLEPSVAGGSGDVTKAYVDASLSIRDGSIIALFAKNAQQDASLNSSFNLASYVDSSSYLKANYVRNASLGNEFYWTSGVLHLNASTSSVSFTYVDGSLLTRDASIAALFAKNAQQDASINSVGSITSYVNSSSYYDASLNNIRAIYIKNSSLNASYFRWTGGYLEPSVAGGSGDVTKAYVDASLSIRDGSIIALFAKNAQQDASLGDIWLISSYVDSSSYLKANYIRNASLSNEFYWSAGALRVNASSAGSTTIAALTDVSITNLVNNSFLKYDSSTGKWKNVISDDASSYFYTKAQVDASFALKGSAGISQLSALTDVCINSVANNNMLKYDSSTRKWINVAPIDASQYFYTKAEIDASFGDTLLLSSYVDSSSYLKANYVRNASLGNEFYWTSGVLHLNASTSSVSFTYVDGSLSTRDASIAALFAKNAQQDASLNSSFNLASYVDSSSYLKANYVRNASLNASYFKWTSGYLEPSVAGGSGDVTKAYVDGSLARRDASLGDIWLISSYVNTSTYYDASLNVKTNFTYDVKQDTSIGLKSDLTYVNASLNAKANLTYVDASLNSLRNLLPPTKTFQTLSIANSSTNWNISNGYNAKITLTTNASLYVINASSGDSGTLIVIQDASGNRTLNLPATSLKNGSWVLSDASNARDIISFLYDGTNYYWNKGGSYV